MIKKSSEIYYFIGIGGVGMSSLARFCFSNGHQVYGYDKVYSETTKNLTDLGIIITYDSSILALSKKLLSKEVKIIYTPAIKSNHPQLKFYNKQGNQILKRAEFLSKICENKKTLAVAGTHGKTTTTSILTHIFSETNQSFTSFMGGFFRNESSNFVKTGLDNFIVEADEYDRSFLKLNPTIACITSVDPDHLDIYENKEAFIEAFKKFSKQVDDKLIVAFGLPISGITYGIDVEADYVARNLTLTDKGYRFDLISPNEIFKGVNFNQLGKHNVLNALGAVAVANQSGINIKKILPTLENFPGIHRRMNVYSWRNSVIIDDYAHHPKEIESVLNTIRNFYPNKKNCVIFQPHLFSRTKDFMKEFCSVLNHFDEIVLLDIFPAREEAIKSVNALALLEGIKNDQKKLIEKKEIKSVLESSDAEVFTFLGAGDIGDEITKLKSELTIL